MRNETFNYANQQIMLKMILIGAPLVDSFRILILKKKLQVSPVFVLETSTWSHFKDNFMLNKLIKICIGLK